MITTIKIIFPTEASVSDGLNSGGSETGTAVGLRVPSSLQIALHSKSRTVQSHSSFPSMTPFLSKGYDVLFPLFGEFSGFVFRQSRDPPLGYVTFLARMSSTASFQQLQAWFVVNLKAMLSVMQFW